MAIEIEEKLGRRIGNTSAERRYIVRGSDDDVEVEAAVVGYSPASITLESGSVLRRQDTSVEELASEPEALWLATVSYSRPDSEQPEPGVDSTFGFETRGGTQRVMQSLETVAGYPANTAEWARPNFGGAIGVTENGPEGVDVTMPVFNFNVTHYWDTITSNYIADLYALTGTVNSGAITISTGQGVGISFAQGELLFLGASGGKRGDNPWEINYAFAASPNATGLVIGDITGIAKKGWEYVWAYYAAREDEDAKMIVRKPIAAYVERVYRTADHGLIFP